MTNAPERSTGQCSKFCSLRLLPFLLGSPVPKDPEKLTDAEKIARSNEWAPFGASAGTYEVRDNTLITHAVVAKNVGTMTLTEQATIKFEGDTFIAHPKPGEPNSDRQTTYTRVR
jgi:hypothetical protein